MKSLKIFLKKSSCGCTAKTRKNKRSQNKRKSKRISKRKNYRGGYKALNTINDEKFSLSSSSSMHRKSKGRSKRASASLRRRS
jgi:hypothetical protein